MTRSLNILFRLASLAGAAAIMWVIAAACNAMGLPLVKWLFIGGVLAMVLFLWGRDFARGVGTYRGVIEAYARRQIQASDLPSDFRLFLTTRHLQKLPKSLVQPRESCSLRCHTATATQSTSWRMSMIFLMRPQLL